MNINFILPETGKPCLLFYALFNLRILLYLIFLFAGTKKSLKYK